MDTIDGIEIYPIISFLIFFSFFVLVSIYVIKKDKKSLEEISNLPLETPNPTEDEKS